MKIKTTPVRVGPVVIGGGSKVKIQSMTTAKTEDVESTLKEILELYEAGCEVIRLTVQGIKQVESVKEIRKRIEEKGLKIPLVADIHFFPKAAFEVAPYVDKVRVNP